MRWTLINKLFCISLGLSLLAACVAPAFPPPPTVTPPARLYPLPHLQSPEYGIQAFLWWHVDNYVAWRDADLVKDMGFGWMKHLIAWRDISNGRGGYDWFRTDWVVRIAEERGLKLLVRLDHQPQWAQADPAVLLTNAPPGQLSDFGDFCAAMAARYKGRVAAYEIWNEPNLAREWGNQPPDPVAYVALLKTGYLAVKAIDPQVIVISAGLAPTGNDDENAMLDTRFLQGMYAAGGAPYFDLLGVHASGYMNPPELSPDDAEADPYLQGRWWTFRHVEDIRAIMVANGDADKQIAITEMGWTSDQVHLADYGWYAVTEEQKAAYLVRAYQYAKAHWQPWIGLMSAIYIADPSWTENDEAYWWAITRPAPPDGLPILLPAYTALKEMQK